MNDRIAQTLYGKPGATQTQSEARKPMNSEQISRTLYGNSSQGAGSIALSLESTLGRLENIARDRDRPDELQDVRQQRRELESFMRQRGMRPDDARDLLNVYVSHAAHPLQPDAQKQRWEGDRGYGALVKKAGSREAADAMVARAQSFYREVAAASPGFARSAVAVGVANHPDVVEIAAKYGAAEARKP